MLIILFNYLLLLLPLLLHLHRCNANEFICDRSCSRLVHGINDDNTFKRGGCCGIEIVKASNITSSSTTVASSSSCGTCQSSTCHGNGFKSCLDHSHQNPHPHSHSPMKMTKQQCEAYQSSNCVVMLANPLCDPSSSICWGTIKSSVNSSTEIVSGR